MLEYGALKNKFRRDFLKGLGDGLSGAGVLFFTFSVVGASSLSSGLTFFQTIVLSMSMFAAPAQLALLDLLTEPSNLYAVGITVFMINVRFSFMTLSLLPYFASRPLKKLIVGLPMLSATTYTLTFLKVSGQSDDVTSPEDYFLGICIVSYAFAMAGVAVGSQTILIVPDKISKLMPMIACLFLAARLMENKWSSKQTAAIIGFVATPYFRYIFGNIGFFICAIFVGMIFSFRRG